MPVQHAVRAIRFRVVHGAIASAILAVSLLAAGCAIEPGWPSIPLLLAEPPVSCTACAVSVADRGALHRVAGLYVTIERNTASRVESVDLEFDLFGANGVPLPAFGRNSFVVRIDAPFAGASHAAFCVSLDDLAAPSADPEGGGAADDLSVDVARLRVARVRLADGAIWVNPGSLLCPEDP